MADVDFYRGVLFAELGEHCRDVDRAHALGLHHPEREGAADAAADGVDGVACRGCRREGRACFRKEGVARVGQLDLVGRAVEQARAELAFEVADIGRDGGLHDVETIGRAREAALLGHRDEHCELPELHVGGGYRQLR